MPVKGTEIILTSQRSSCSNLIQKFWQEKQLEAMAEVTFLFFFFIWPYAVSAMIHYTEWIGKENYRKKKNQAKVWSKGLTLAR